MSMGARFANELPDAMSRGVHHSSVVDMPTQSNGVVEMPTQSNGLPRLTLVISTIQRTTTLIRLLCSLRAQEFKDFETIIVDQNVDDRLVPILLPFKESLNLSHLRASGEKGVSRGRNIGWRKAQGDVVVFPDDDCWYPPCFLRRGLEIMDATAADIVSGRPGDEKGRVINGRFGRRRQCITRHAVWTHQQEWALFVRVSVLTDLNGFDDAIGIGSPTPWQAAEGPDLILSALRNGRRCYFDPSLMGFHSEFDLDDKAMTLKARQYGRGMGFVLRRHGFGIISIIYWVSRPVVKAISLLIVGKFQRSNYYKSMAIGRFEGWRGRLF